MMTEEGDSDEQQRLQRAREYARQEHERVCTNDHSY